MKTGPKPFLPTPGFGPVILSLSFDLSLSFAELPVQELLGNLRVRFSL